MSRVIPFPTPPRPCTGTIHVLGDKATGYQVAHESASGNSWGNFSGPYALAQDAISAAYRLSRDTYLGGCDVVICDPALKEREADEHRAAWEDF